MTAELREFIFEHFSRDELMTFCVDYFRDFYEDYEDSTITKMALVRDLIEHCTRRGEMPKLQAGLQNVRPEQYTTRFGRIVVAQVKAKPRDPRQIFLSHAHEDAAFAQRLAADLRTAGFPVWMTPDSIQPGEPWVRAIDRGLPESGVFIVVLSEHSVKSMWVQTEMEVALAEHQRGTGRLIPLLVQPCEVRDLSILLTRLQHIDFTGRYESGKHDLMHALGVAIPKTQAEARNTAPPVQHVSPVQVPTVRSDSHQQSTTSSRNPDLFILESPFRLELVRVPAGSFWMGSDMKMDKSARENELPQHTVDLSEFYIGKYPVTVAQFAAFTHASQFITTAEREGSAFVLNGKVWKDMKGANWQYPRGPKSNVTNKQNHPVTCVSWEDAKAFCEWLSKITSMSFSFSLPTEAQWERVARGNDGRIYPWGNDAPDAKRCNFNMNVGDTTPVGALSPMGDSPFGTADMSGNVWEWVADWYDEKLYATRANRFVKDPVGPASGQHRVLRGGS